jgi:hypothetical protein
MSKEKWVFTFGPDGPTFQGEPMEVLPVKEWFEYHPFLGEVKKIFTQHELIFTLEERIAQLKRAQSE